MWAIVSHHPHHWTFQNNLKQKFFTFLKYGNNSKSDADKDQEIGINRVASNVLGASSSKCAGGTKDLENQGESDDDVTQLLDIHQDEERFIVK